MVLPNCEIFLDLSHNSSSSGKFGLIVGAVRYLIDRPCGEGGWLLWEIHLYNKPFTKRFSFLVCYSSNAVFLIDGNF